ncbi:MAG: 3-phosphoserine/phosphohydroxythreonine transaminase [Deltaproteobacteria bacterium]|nr:3-phosphoserine/phosphohydroxythreonine transaminase [Deltaproteobacteria bacterium]
MEKRIHNFNAGPAILPLPVLEEIRDEFINYKGSGMSITEVSHRSKWFDDVINEAIERTKRLLGLDDGYKVLFIQGGASVQFCMVPMNLSVEGKSVDYLNTGTWATKAINEAEIQGKNVRVIASSKDRDFAYIPRDFKINEDASYLHFTSNNTIKGTQWTEFPKVANVPLVCDMSSDFMSRPFDISPFGLVYAGAQKNIGPSGTALVVIREDMLERVPANLPSMLKYTTFAGKNSMYNTPSCFVIYVISLVLKWLEETVGGLDKMENINREKARLIYDLIDSSDFYRGTADNDSRSMMNVTFRLPDETLEAKFISESQKQGMGGLKGHRSVGGCRASIYNACSIDSVKALVEFMAEFEKKEG